MTDSHKSDTDKTESKIDDIVAMLDSFMSSGGGHMDIHVDDANENVAAIETTISKECLTGNMACKVPTLMDGMDNNEFNINTKTKEGGK